jgi:Kef-type K+ transport system membrane component KefB
MNATTLFVVGLFLLVACAVLVGEAMARLGVLPLVGQLAVGILFGPTLLGPALGLANLSADFQGVQILATFFVLITAGLAVTPAQVRSTGAQSVLLGLTIFVVPFALGALAVRALYPGLPAVTSLFVSLTVSITALPVLAIMLREFGLLESRIGTVLLSGAFVNELAAVTVFAVLLRYRSGSGNLDTAVATALLAVGLFLGSIYLAYRVLRGLRELQAWSRIADWFQRTWRSQEAGFAMLMVAALGSALYSQYLGLTYLVGSFSAGLLVSPESAGPEGYAIVRRVFDMITWGFFIPLFFALVGLQMNLRLLGVSAPTLAAFAGLCAFAVTAKFVFGGLLTRRLGGTARAAAACGFLLSSRGAVELAMAVTLLSLGVFSEQLYTVVAGVGLVTTLVSPVAARPFLRSLRATAGGATAPAPA